MFTFLFSFLFTFFYYQIQVGLPAKSGVSGALVLVIPNVCAIGLWSPPLDALGNTVRGVQFAKQLVRSFNFHRFDHLFKTGSKSDPRKFRNEYLRQSTLRYFLKLNQLELHLAKTWTTPSGQKFLLTVCHSSLCGLALAILVL